MCRVFLCDLIHENSLFKPKLLWQCWLTYCKGKDFLGTLHSLLSHFIFHLPYRRLYIVSKMCIYNYVHISECVQAVYELYE
jgi:hypothetical protein